MADRKAAGGLPFVGNMTDGFDFVRKMWGVTGLPGLPTVGGITQFAHGLPQALPSMITPTLDLDELDKRITDLRAVEQWLALNANMLRATIQSLEVQRNTIATLKNLGGSMLSSVTARAHRRRAHRRATSSAAYLRQAEARGTARRQAVAEAAAQAVAPAAAVSMPAPAAPASARRAAPRPPRRKADANAAAAMMPLNPAQWWGALQDQFARVAAVAAAEAARSDKPGAAGERIAKTARRALATAGTPVTPKRAGAARKRRAG
ncbi:MAG: PhaM family polyhydroxyalkanoate granule multifunctional regulatory protein [Burkholderiaceae bacterium]|nr:PhaM family polyhydroxyalkanoate granule multifunctional regulatory protein [Burkholderiaceae bacterium]